MTQTPTERAIIDQMTAMHEPNTCQRAWDILCRRYQQPKGAPAIAITLKLAAPGTVSNGDRRVTLEPCPRWRWITATNGAGETLAEIDQRDHWDDPSAMVQAFEAALTELEIDRC